MMPLPPVPDAASKYDDDHDAVAARTGRRVEEG
jgi:hypothetical protein